jgi:hypothetical protein
LGDGWFDRKAGFIGSIGAGKSWENDEKRWEKQGKIGKIIRNDQT